MPNNDRFKNKVVYNFMKRAGYSPAELPETNIIKKRKKKISINEDYIKSSNEYKVRLKYYKEFGSRTKTPYKNRTTKTKPTNRVKQTFAKDISRVKSVKQLSREEAKRMINDFQKKFYAIKSGMTVKEYEAVTGYLNKLIKVVTDGEQKEVIKQLKTDVQSLQNKEQNRINRQTVKEIDEEIISNVEEKLNYIDNNDERLGQLFETIDDKIVVTELGNEIAHITQFSKTFDVDAFKYFMKSPKLMAQLEEELDKRSISDRILYYSPVEHSFSEYMERYTEYVNQTMADILYNEE